MADVSGGGSWATRLDQESNGTLQLSEELVAVLRHRVASQYYDRPQVLDVIARAILNSRELYPA